MSASPTENFTGARPDTSWAWHRPPAALTLSGPDVHLWRVALDADEGVVRRCRQLLSRDERSRADRFRFDRHRRRFVVGRGALRCILARYLSTSARDLRFDYTSHGKPLLAHQKGAAPPQFSLAHSADLALVAVARERRVGVDIEQLNARVDPDQTAGVCCSPAEKAALHSLAPPARLVAFFNCWTRKEAFAKAQGEGLSIPLDQVEVSLRPGEPTRLLSVFGDPEAGARWSLHAPMPDPGYAAALAVEGSPGRIVCFAWRFDEPGDHLRGRGDAPDRLDP